MTGGRDPYISGKIKETCGWRAKKWRKGGSSPGESFWGDGTKISLVLPTHQIGWLCDHDAATINTESCGAEPRLL